MGATRHVDLNGPHISGTPKKIIVFLSSFISNIQHFNENKNPMLVEDRFQLKNGFNYSPDFKGSKDYILTSAWEEPDHQVVIKLIRINDGKLMYKWKVNIDMINKSFNSTYTYGKKNEHDNYTTCLLHPLLLNDGSVIVGGGGISFIDKKAKMRWSNKVNCHHSIEQDLDSNLWICGYNTNQKISNKLQMKDDAIQKIDLKTGKLLFQKSVLNILLENGFNLGDILVNSQIAAESKYLDYLHLNDIQPVLNDSKYWKKGDLFLSLRNQNLVLLYRPSTNKIIWYKRGPWLKQHDITILDSNRISIFGNDVLDIKFSSTFNQFIHGHNVIYMYDFSKNTLSTPYNHFLKTSKVRTVTEGRSKVLKDGNVFVEESNYGRLLLGNQRNELWSYTVKVDDNKLSTFNWCRYITEDEFKKFTFVKKTNQ